MPAIFFDKDGHKYTNETILEGIQNNIKIVRGGFGGSFDGSWASAVQEMGKWYESNVHTYSQGERTECPLVDNYGVRHDCSGYVCACLWLFGALPKGQFYQSAGFTTDANLASTLESKGFVGGTYSVSEVKPYDIISYCGHVEIYAGNGKSWAWGNVHDTEHGGLPCGTAAKTKYQKIWRRA